METNIVAAQLVGFLYHIQTQDHMTGSAQIIICCS